jgi:hypothetical protein
MGSIAFSGMARSEILLGRNPEDLRERVLFLIKCSEREAQAISYRCDGFFEWCGLSDLTPQDLGKSGGEKGQRDWGQTLCNCITFFIAIFKKVAEISDPKLSIAPPTY